MNKWQKADVQCTKNLIKIFSTKGIKISFRYARVIIRNPNRINLKRR